MNLSNEKIYCPVNGWDCPYWNKDGTCSLENVTEECDDYMSIMSFFEDEDV